MTNRKQFIELKTLRLVIARDALVSMEVTSPHILELKYGHECTTSMFYRQEGRAEEVMNAITYMTSDVEVLEIDE